MSNAESAYGGAESAYGGAESAYGGAESAYGGAESARRRAAGRLARKRPAEQNPPAAARWARPVLIAITALCGLVLLARFVGEPLMTIRHVTRAQRRAPRRRPGARRSRASRAGSTGTRCPWPPSSGGWKPARSSGGRMVERVFPDTIRLTLWGTAARGAGARHGRTGAAFPSWSTRTASCSRWEPAARTSTSRWSPGSPSGTWRWARSSRRAYRALFADLRALREKAPALYRGGLRGAGGRRSGSSRPLAAGPGAPRLPHLVTRADPGPGLHRRKPLKYALMASTSCRARAF